MRNKKILIMILAAAVVILLASRQKTAKKEITDTSVASITDAVMEEEVSTATDADASPGEADIAPDKESKGIVSAETVKKAYVWLSEIKGLDAFEVKYSEVAAFFGTGGAFDKEEFDESIGANYMYYKWVSEEDETVFLYVTFKQGEDEVYRVSGYNTSGFTADDAVNEYLDELREGE